MAIPGLALILAATLAAVPPLQPQQAGAFRAWFTRIVREQLRRGPNPRWTHRDCAGLIRFATREALRPHDARWRQANGLAQAVLPPDVHLDPSQTELLHGWRDAQNRVRPFARAIQIVQHNSVYVGHDINAAQAGDLLFYDQGDDQHLMIWLGAAIAYHNGSTSPQDSGLRLLTPEDLLHWKDTRWLPTLDNPNFAGIYRFTFLAR